MPRARCRCESASRAYNRGVDAPVKVACVQAEPVILDRDATVRKLAQLTAEAAEQGASLVVFPEAFIPVYPSSTWAKALAGWEDARAKAAFAQMAEQSVAVGLAEVLRRERLADRAARDLPHVQQQHPVEVLRHGR